jgi:hypothetical protein
MFDVGPSMNLPRQLSKAAVALRSFNTRPLPHPTESVTQAAMEGSGKVLGFHILLKPLSMTREMG